MLLYSSCRCWVRDRKSWVCSNLSLELRSTVAYLSDGIGEFTMVIVISTSDSESCRRTHRSQLLTSFVCIVNDTFRSIKHALVRRESLLRLPFGLECTKQSSCLPSPMSLTFQPLFFLLRGILHELFLPVLPLTLVSSWWKRWWKWMSTSIPTNSRRPLESRPSYFPTDQSALHKTSTGTGTCTRIDM